MKLSIERGALLKSLAHVQSVVERRNTIPILSNVLMDASKSELRLTATDLDIEIVDTVPAKVTRAGAVTAPAHMLYEIVRKLPEGAQVTVEHNGDDPRVFISAGRSEFKLASLPREDFPAMPQADLPHKFVLSVDDLKRLIDRTRFAISTEETRYYLMGIFLHALKKKKLLRAVATDGHRLARAEVPLPKGAENLPGVIIPRKTVQEVRKLLDDAEGEITLAFSDNKVRFEIGGIVLTSKLIDGTFPDYERVIPATNGHVLSFEGSIFKSAVDRVSAVSTERSRAVKLSLDGERLTLTVNNPDSGSATEELVVSYDAEPLEIGFNAKYLLDIMDQLTGPEARLHLTDAQSPTVVKDSEDEGVLYVLMPMRV
ncbi:MAG: DNA polymerase III subunit beta [Alphaproteobacteria bacterium]